MPTARRSALIGACTATIQFLLLTAVGYVAFLAQQKNAHSVEILSQHWAQILWTYTRLGLVYALVGAAAGACLHPLLPGKKAVLSTLLVIGLSILYTITSGSHVLYGALHKLVVVGGSVVPRPIQELYQPDLALVALAVLVGSGILAWAWRGRRAWPALLVIGGTVAWYVAPGERRDASVGDGRPSFVLICSDSLRADHLGANGYGRDTSPAIDALAARGTNFSTCLVPTASTHESWVSIMSGTPPRTNGLRHMFPSRERVAEIEETETFLPAYLGEHGYATKAVGGWCGTTFRLFDMGFDVVDVSKSQNVPAVIAEAALINHVGAILFVDNPLGRLLLPEVDQCSFTRAGASLTRRANEAIDDLSAEESPFFLVVTYHGTHLPYSATWPYYLRYRAEGYQGRNEYRIDFGVDDMIQRGFDHDLTESESQHIVDLYDGCVREFDDQVGAIIDHLRSRGLLDRTIVGVIGDHGDDLYEHGTTLGHGVTLFGGDQANHIPAIFAGPGIPKRDEPKITRSFDLAPTWLTWMGLPHPERYEGNDLCGEVPDQVALLETSYLLYRQPIPDLLEGEEPRKFPRWDDATFIDETFDMNFVLRDEFAEEVLQTKCFAVREGHYKLIAVPGESGPILRLFDLQSDPSCRVDRKADLPEVFLRLSRRLPDEAPGSLRDYAGP